MYLVVLPMILLVVRRQQKVGQLLLLLLPHFLKEQKWEVLQGR